MVMVATYTGKFKSISIYWYISVYFSEKPNMTNAFYEDILAQPDVLCGLIEHHFVTDPKPLRSSAAPSRPLLTGMGASYHAAWITSYHLVSKGIVPLVQEAADLVFYTQPMLDAVDACVFVSQSGRSAEVQPVVKRLGEQVRLTGVTNEPDSPLGQAADQLLWLAAGDEKYVAAKTYMNSLAVLWLLARQWSGGLREADADTLKGVADRIAGIISQAEATTARWIDQLDGVDHLLFVGHGPHAATARQSAMMLNEWTKVSAFSASIGAYLHGFIESSGPELGAVVYAPPGITSESALAVAERLQRHGAKVLVVANGQTLAVGERVSSGVDEYLSPMLDVVAAQLFAEAYARHRGVEPGFRYLTKVVTQI